MATGVRLGPGKADRERAARSVRRLQIAARKVGSVDGGGPIDAGARVEVRATSEVPRVCERSLFENFKRPLSVRRSIVKVARRIATRIYRYASGNSIPASPQRCDRVHQHFFLVRSVRHARARASVTCAILAAQNRVVAFEIRRHLRNSSAHRLAMSACAELDVDVQHLFALLDARVRAGVRRREQTHQPRVRATPG